MARYFVECVISRFDSHCFTIALLHKDLRLNVLTAFGLFAVSAMLVFYAMEKRSLWFVLAFAAACVLWISTGRVALWRCGSNLVSGRAPSLVACTDFKMRF